MLRQDFRLEPKKPKNFEDTPLFQKTFEPIPFKHAVGLSVVSHGTVWILCMVVPLILLLLGFQLNLFHKPSAKPRDIEFVLVNQPEQEPINKNTPLRAERNTRAGGIHDPNKRIAPPQPALPKSAPSQQNNQTVKKVTEKQAPQKQVQQPKPQQQVQKTVEKPKQVAQKPAPPKPTARPNIPPRAHTAMKLPVPSSNGIPKIAKAPTGPVSTKPYHGSGSGSGHAAPKPIIASGGYSNGRAIQNPANKGSGAGSRYSPGGSNAGNPGPGNPKGAPGVDAIKEPNFGPYMSELSRRIKANWDPPRGEESKRVVLLFKIAKDGRLLSVKVLKSSGTPSADRAALAAVELTAPFRPLPKEFTGTNVDIQFTFDYNVFGVNKY